MFEVYITKSAKFLPNDPISNDDMELYLGKVNNIASKARRVVLRNNGITSRYYAIDKEGKSTHNNADLTFEAIKGLYDDSFTPKDVEVLSCGTSIPDNLLPSHAAMVHGLMKNRSVELNSSSGVCCSGMNSLKYGFMSVQSGNSETAICTGSERVSSILRSNKFEEEIVNLKDLEEQPILAFKKDFLRWMLSDGAGALLLENKPKGTCSLKIEWMKSFSFAHELESCMYAGGDKQENGDIKPWTDFTPQEWLTESVFTIKQDVKLLNEQILQKGAQSMKVALEEYGVTSDDIDYFLPHVSSHYFAKGVAEGMKSIGVEIAPEKWFMNLKDVGNMGSASIYIMVEELMNSGKLKKGEKILLSVPESGRFSYAYAYLTVS